jgi:hypothetical protein
MKNYKKLFLVVFTSTFALIMTICSCSQDKSVVNLIPSNLIDYMNVTSKNYQGGITIGNSCESFGNVNKNQGITYLQGYVDGKFENLKVGEISIQQDKDNYFNIGSSKSLYALFGQKVNVTLNKSSFLREGSEFSTNIDLPIPVQVLSPIAVANSPEITTISKTQKINWVANTSSKRPINIIIDYTNQHPFNKSFQDFPKFKKLIETEDNGEYQLKPSDFEGIPTGACIQILVGRGDYVIPTNGAGQNYLITTYSLNRADFKLIN